MAWLFLSDPETWFATLEIQLVSPAGYAELKSLYIGLMAAAGCYFIITAFSQSMRFAALLFAILSYAGLTAVRSWEIFMEQNSSEVMLQLFFVEALMLLAAVFAMYCGKLASGRKRNPYY